MANAMWTPLNGEQFTILDALLVSLIAIVVVFIVLTIIILVCGGAQKCIDVTESKTNIKPRPENSILEEDEDAVIAVLTATIDFNKETGKDAHLISVKKIDEE